MKAFARMLLAVFCSLAEVAHAALFNFMARRGMLLTAVQLPNGSIVEIAASYGPESDITALSNANPAIATLDASHGIEEGDYFEVISGWSRLTNKIVRAGTVAVNDVALEGINTIDTTAFPASAGVGTAREILTWTQLQQILELTTDGGEQNFLTYQFLEDDAQKRIPTFKAPTGMTILVADDPSLAGYQLAEVANDDRQQRAVRFRFPNGSILLLNAFVTLNKTPRMTINELMAVEVTLSLTAEPVRYASTPTP